MSLRHRLEFATTVHNAKHVPAWSVEKIAALREQRLRALLRAAVERSPFYRDRYRGLDIATAPLTAFPAVTKDELRDCWDEVPTDRELRLSDVESFVGDEANLGRWYRGRYAVCHTSGSQGRPLVIVQDRHCLNVIFALLASRCSVEGPPSLAEAFRRLIRPKRVAAISFRRGPYPSGMLLEFMGEILGRFVEVRRYSSIEPDLAVQLEQFNPDSITGYASVLEALAIADPPPRLPRLGQLTNSSEYLPLRARTRIEAGFRAPILDHYGTGECLQLADGCPHCGHLHVNDDWAILESVDEHNRPVPPGVTGDKILVTNLANHVQPFIRYEVGDRVALATEPCPVRRTTRIGTLEGRSSEAFPVHNGAEKRLLPGILFHAALDTVGLVQEWQTIHKGPAHVEIRVQPIPGQVVDFAQLEASLREGLKIQELPPWVRVDIRLVDQILPNERTGKMQRYLREYIPSAAPSA